MWGISNFVKLKKLGFFSIANPLLAYFQYIFAHCFTSKLRKIKKKDKEKIKYKMYSAGFELTIPDSKSWCFHHCAMEDLQFSNSIFAIYRQPIFIMNLNAVKIVSRQSELLSCLPTVNTHDVFRLFHAKKRTCRNCQNELARLSNALCPLIQLHLHRVSFIQVLKKFECYTCYIKFDPKFNTDGEVRWIGCLTSQLTIFQSYMWRHIDVQADWKRRSWTYGRAPNAIDIL